jgi:hypothetical protein
MFKWTDAFLLFKTLNSYISFTHWRPIK